ncbi:hypothetical protein JTB14_003334 [Gonioctena quinquepunctata]|nr:hypothetical protein JTB14_003334 [Gonioctena quinquepunctata]
MSSPEFDSCLNTAVEKGFELIGSTGISSLYFPSLEPLQIPSLTLGAGSGAVNLVQHYQNIRTYGLSITKVKNAHFDEVGRTLSFNSYYKEIRQEAEYELSGKVMFLPVFGKGDSVLKFRNVTIGHMMSFYEKIKDNKTHFLLSDYKAMINIGGAHYDFRNLFNGDEKLGQPILLVINENWDLVFEDIREQIETAYARVIRSMATRFFENIPIYEIFLK